MKGRSRLKKCVRGRRGRKRKREKRGNYEEERDGDGRPDVPRVEFRMEGEWGSLPTALHDASLCVTPKVL